MRLADVTRALEEIAPPAWAEPWDNVGLLVGDPAARVVRVLFTIDYTDAVAREAEAAKADLVVAYHPPIFAPLKRIAHEGVVARAVRAGIALYSPHTALDVADGGTNDMLADVVGLTSRSPLAVRALTGSDAGAAPRGLGRVGELAAPVARQALVERIKVGLGLDRVLVAGPTDGEATRVAVSAGASGDMFKDALAARADLYLTGEMRHHDALACAARGMTVVCALHSNSERKALRRYAERLTVATAGLLITVSEADRDPFSFA